MSGGDRIGAAAGDSRQRPFAVAGSAEAFVTVTDLAAELGITPRTLRFYEDQGLIAPRRIAATRIYSHRDRARMILILRGKQLGFSLREIRDYLDLYDADPKHETQTRALLQKIAERRRQLEDKRLAIEAALEGLDRLERDAEAILARAGLRRAKRDLAKRNAPRRAAAKSAGPGHAGSAPHATSSEV